MSTGPLVAGGYLLCTAAMAAFAYVYWLNRTLRGVQYLLVAALIGSVQSACYLLLLGAPSVLTKAILGKLVGVLTLVVVVLWYLFAAAWTGRHALARRPAVALVGAPLAVGAGALVTNVAPTLPGYHALYWTDVAVAEGAGPFVPLSATAGPVALAASVYVSAVLAGTVALLGSFARRPEQRLYRWRNALVALGPVVALLFGVGSALLDVAYASQPFAYALASGLVVLGVARFGSYDVASLPKHSLIEAIDGAVLVYDADGTVMAVDGAARRVLGLTGEVVGLGIVGVVEMSEALPGVRDDGAGDRAPDHPAAVAERLDGHEFTERIDGASRTFVVRVSPLEDGGDRLGWTVVCYDVTDLRQKQQELDLLKQVLSRVLRHNVRNDLSVVKANAEELARDASGLEAERLRTILEKSDNLLSASEKARTVEKLLDADRSRTDLDPVEVTADAVESVRREYPGVTVETDLPAACEVRAHWALSTAVENVVENAAMHNGAPDPRVAVSISRTGERVHLRVADNGPGIPYSELAMLERREETQLEHGSSVGLWLVDWIVDLSGGDLDFENTEQGCTVTFGLEPATGAQPDAGADSGTPNLGVGAVDD